MARETLISKNNLDKKPIFCCKMRKLVLVKHANFAILAPNIDSRKSKVLRLRTFSFLNCVKKVEEPIRLTIRL